MSVDVASIKKDFPILDDPNLYFLDSAASSQRPRQVTDAMTTFYESEYANVHRGVYDLAMAATNRYEQARHNAAAFIGSDEPNEIVFTKNATEAFNLVAASWGRANLTAGDKVVVTVLDHHANIVPWQVLEAEIGIELVWVESTADGRLEMEGLQEKIAGAKMVAFTAMSNVTGAITPVKEICAMAKAAGAKTSVDAVQHVPHRPTNIKDWDADFVAFSSHKMLGPSGIGVLWGRLELLEAMPPFLVGGGMISTVTRDGFTPAELPSKFEAGTPPIAEAVGLTAAIDYLKNIGMENVAAHEEQLAEYFLQTVFPKISDKIKLIGPEDNNNRGAVFSFDVNGVHAHDVSQVLNDSGVAVRPGHHCAKPLMAHFGVDATARASFYVYNDEADVDALGDAIIKAYDYFN